MCVWTRDCTSDPHYHAVILQACYTIYLGSLRFLQTHLRHCPGLTQLSRHAHIIRTPEPQAHPCTQCVLHHTVLQVALSQVDELLNPKSSAPLAELNPPAQTSSLQQLRLLVQRNQLSYWRNPATNLSRFLVTLAMALIVGSIEWGKGE